MRDDERNGRPRRAAGWAAVLACLPLLATSYALATTGQPLVDPPAARCGPPEDAAPPRQAGTPGNGAVATLRVVLCG